MWWAKKSMPSSLLTYNPVSTNPGGFWNDLCLSSVQCFKAKQTKLIFYLDISTISLEVFLMVLINQNWGGGRYH